MFAEILKKLRKEHQMTQAELAKILNIDASTVSKYENGAASPSVESLIILSNIFNVSVDFLLGKTKIRQKSNYMLNLPNNILNALEIMETLTPEQQAQAIQFLRFLSYINDIKDFQ